MSHRLEDLFQKFTDMMPTDQAKFIDDIRNNRNVERPAVAVRKRKESIKKVEKAKATVGSLLEAMSPEQRAALKAKLLGDAQ